jgi:hypothetical protein
MHVCMYLYAMYAQAAMFMIHLTQREGDSSQHYTTLHSTLAIVETPATNVLSIPPQQVYNVKHCIYTVSNSYPQSSNLCTRCMVHSK